MAAGNNERRPRPESGAQVDNDDAADSTVPCWICGRTLRAEKSVLLGIGPRCWSERMGAQHG
ncbi:hypothetical protein NBCG_01080 [Nocardioidaceae bacterium Broad-1]|nr:hypothetical protein NBCG_01080 [Nocardioidaceae bacterium Broad-1]